MKLEWHKDTMEDVTWDEALKYCESLGDGWRLPTIEELFSVIDYSEYNPATHVKGFLESSYYWSSTTYAYENESVWLVYFLNGYVLYGYKDYSHCVRAVREVKI